MESIYQRDAGPLDQPQPCRLLVAPGFRCSGRWVLPRDERNDLRYSHIPWLLEPETWQPGRAWVDRNLHRDHKHYPLPAWCLGPRGGRIPDHDLADRFPDEGRSVPDRVILSAEARPDARCAGGDAELSSSPPRGKIYRCALLAPRSMRGPMCGFNKEGTCPLEYYLRAVALFPLWHVFAT